MPVFVLVLVCFARVLWAHQLPYTGTTSRSRRGTGAALSPLAARLVGGAFPAGASLGADLVPNPVDDEEE